MDKKYLLPLLVLGGVLLFMRKSLAGPSSPASSPSLPPPQGQTQTSNIREIIRQEARREGIPECILLGIAKAESSLNPYWFYRYHPDGVSFGAFGLTRGAVKTIGMNWEAVKQSIILQARASARYLKWLYRRLKNWDLAIQAYNIGIGNVRKGRRNYTYLRRVKRLGGC